METMTKKAHKTGKTSAPARAIAPEVAGDVEAFVREMFSDLAPIPGADESGSNIVSAVLSDEERDAIDAIAALMGKSGSRSIVMKIAARRLIASAIEVGVFADTDDEEKA